MPSPNMSKIELNPDSETQQNREDNGQPLLSEQFDRAFLLASHLHRRQRRKGLPVPYLSHLLSCAAFVMEAQGDEDEICAAVLHDAVEDQGGMPIFEKIKAEFGERVAQIVLDCSDTTTYPKPSWKERKSKYIEHLKSATTSARLVSLADKVHNLHSLLTGLARDGEDMWSHFRGSPREILWYYTSLFEVFSQNPEPRIQSLLKRFEQLVKELQSLINSETSDA